MCAESEDACVKPENELVSFVSDASWEKSAYSYPTCQVSVEV